MKLAEVEAILRECGIGRMEVKAGKLIASCPFAWQSHAKGTDSTPSFAVLHTRFDTWAYSCRACSERGSLKNLIWRLTKGKRKVRALAIYYEALDLDEAAEGHRSRLDYRPFAAAPSIRHDVPVVRHEYAAGIDPVRGKQLALVGDARPEYKPPCNEDLKRFRPGPVQYMTDRGFDAETQAAFEIMDDRLRYRAVFPIRSWDGDLLGITRRSYWTELTCYSCHASIDNGRGAQRHKCPNPDCGRFYVKYVHTKGLDRNQILYGEWLHQPGAVPVLCEGTTDAMRLWQYGVRPPEFVPLAILGAYPDEAQAARLVQRTGAKRAFVVRDNDEPTPKFPEGAGAELAPRLRQVAPSSLAVCELVTTAKDPGSLNQLQVEVLLAEMRRLLTVEIFPKRALIAC